MKFSDYSIPDRLKTNLSKLGFHKPTDIQYKSIPSILKGEDLLAISQTGTGKTLAFAIPLVALILKKYQRKGYTKSLKCLVLVPTRELALQLSKEFIQIATNTKINIGTLYGGVDFSDQVNEIKKGIDILVSTPGRLFDLHAQNILDLSEVEMLVLDEADHMLDLGFLKDIQDVISRLPKVKQTLFFSATINKKIKKLAYSLLKGSAIRIQISPKNKVNRNINHLLAHVKMDDKRFFLERIVKEYEDAKIIVFVRTRVRADRVVKAMGRVGISAQAIHGNVQQAERFSIMQRFRNAKNKILIATDVSARGIDIPDIDLVINYDLPDPPDQYVHRVGRTGRGVRKGLAISFCAEEELQTLESIQNYIEMKIPLAEVSSDDYDDTISSSKDADFDVMQLIKEAEIRKKKGRSKRKK